MSCIITFFKFYIKKIYASMSRASVKSGDVKRAVQLLRDMRVVGVEPDVPFVWLRFGHVGK